MSGMPSSGGRREARERFAESLRRLRAEAGNPSFREMAASRTVSHTTLHEAARGTRFPSWTTTQAFVEACGGDVEEWRKLWTAALGSDAPAVKNVTAPAPETVTASEPAPDGIADTGPIPTPKTKGRRGRSIALAVGCGTLGAAAIGGYAIMNSGEHKPDSKPTDQATTANGPVLTGDKSAFIADLTIPDGAKVKAGRRFVKTWEIANVGTVPWHGRFLARAALPKDNGTCSTPGKVRLPDTEPGGHTRVSVHVTAPNTPGSCWVGWKMVDGQGAQLLPAARPIYFEVRVVG
ncbi:NBR1-Ig-like domain-containing protein [Spirillospora sp. NPDC052269]